jgi:hypothetical protein
LRFAASLPEARRARVAAHFWPALAQQIHPFGGLMKLKVVVCLLAFASLFAAGVSAQDVQKFDLFAGYSYVRANPGTSGVDGFNLHGGSASIAYNATRWLSGVADFGGYRSGNILGTGVDGTLSTYLFGPRVSYRQRIRQRCAESEQSARFHGRRFPLLTVFSRAGFRSDSRRFNCPARFISVAVRFSLFGDRTQPAHPTVPGRNWRQATFYCWFNV